MNIYYTLSLVFFLTLSCKSKKETIEVSTQESKQTSVSSPKTTTQKPLLEAVLLKDKEALGCATKIKLLDSDDLLDPININEDFLTSAKHEEKIWISFTSLRMKNRCDEARPIKIFKIEKRD